MTKLLVIKETISREINNQICPSEIPSINKKEQTISVDCSIDLCKQHTNCYLNNDKIINFIYYSIFIALGSKQLIKNLVFKPKRIDFEIIENSKKYLLFIIICQFLIGIIFFGSIKEVTIVLICLYSFWYLYRKFGLIFIIFTSIFYFQEPYD